MANAVPMALGKWDAMVEVWGGVKVVPSPSPNTLWRPPETGSAAAAHRERQRSKRGVEPPAAWARRTMSPPQR